MIPDLDNKIAYAKLAKKCKYLVVGRGVYEQLMNEEAKRKKLSEDEAFLVVVDVYKGLIVAVTDKRGFTFDVI